MCSCLWILTQPDPVINIFVSPCCSFSGCWTTTPCSTNCCWLELLCRTTSRSFSTCSTSSRPRGSGEPELCCKNVSLYCQISKGIPHVWSGFSVISFSAVSWRSSWRSLPTLPRRTRSRSYTTCWVHTCSGGWRLTSSSTCPPRPSSSSEWSSASCRSEWGGWYSSSCRREVRGVDMRLNVCGLSAGNITNLSWRKTLRLWTPKEEETRFHCSTSSWTSKNAATTPTSSPGLLWYDPNTRERPFI